MSSSSDDDREAIVFDIGSHSARAGFAGDDEPSVELKYLDCPEFRDTYCNRGYQIYNPESFDLDIKEKIISKCYDLLGSDTEDVMKGSPALFTVHFNDSLSVKESMLELMFEKFDVPGLYMAPSPVLSLYSSGRGSGIVLESGNSVTQTVAIYESYMYANSVLSENNAGAEVTRVLKASCENAGSTFTDADYVHLKEQYSSLEVNAQTTEVELPDGTVHELENSFLRACAASLFDLDSGLISLPEMVYKSIMVANIHCRKDLFANIILSGGNTMISGLPDQLTNSLNKIVSKRHRGLKVRTVASPERCYFPWIGGSILGSLSCYMNSLFLTREMYQDYGSQYIHKLCFNPANSIQG